MSNPYRIRKLIAILLILALSPRMGMSLYLHNWLHASVNNQAANASSANCIRYACDCVSDFSLPFIQADPVTFSLPVIAALCAPATDIIPIPSLTKFYHSLRAPPVFTASL